MQQLFSVSVSVWWDGKWLSNFHRYRRKLYFWLSLMLGERNLAGTRNLHIAIGPLGVSFGIGRYQG